MHIVIPFFTVSIVLDGNRDVGVVGALGSETQRFRSQIFQRFRRRFIEGVVVRPNHFVPPFVIVFVMRIRVVDIVRLVSHRGNEVFVVRRCGLRQDGHSHNRADDDKHDAQRDLKMLNPLLLLTTRIRKMNEMRPS